MKIIKKILLLIIIKNKTICLTLILIIFKINMQINKFSINNYSCNFNKNNNNKLIIKKKLIEYKINK